MLEESFVLFNLRGFSRNLGKEVTRKSRYYFWDNGVLNGLISDFNSTSIGNDLGKLWENFLVTERLKKQEYKNIFANNYFWRTYNQEEVDWGGEEREGRLFGYEIKWSPAKKTKAPKDWKETHSNARYRVGPRENCLNFVI